MDKLGSIRRQGRVLELGALGYYWKATDAFQNEVVISAHGGYEKRAVEDLDVKAEHTLKYYVDHGNLQNDFGLNKFAAATRPPVREERVGTDGAKTWNYQLSKYQGKHGSKTETYKYISNLAPETIAANTKMKEMWKDSPNIDDYGNSPIFDVVTLRNRCWSSGADLKTVLDLIWKCRGPGCKAAIIHCFFCRGRM